MVTLGGPAKLLGVLVLTNLGLVWLMWSEGRRLESLVEQAVVTAQVHNRNKIEQQQSLIDSLKSDLISLRSSSVLLSDFKQLQNEVADSKIPVAGTPAGTPGDPMDTMLRPLGPDVPSLENRLGRLETITKGRLNWMRDPYISSSIKHKCKKQEAIAEQFVCFDNFPPAAPAPCVVYDFGIREQPEFGMQIAERFPQCEVHAFDPSPVSVQFMHGQSATANRLQKLPNYHFYSYGAGGVDGIVKLYDYNWGQVSSVRVPYYISRDCGYGDGDDMYNPNTKPRGPELAYHLRRCRSGDHISVAFGTSDGFGDKVHLLEVKTLGTIMKALGHKHIDLLKLDVEGSEYAFLEAALDEFDCPPVSQMTVEWHHFVFDKRYGGGSSPEMNAIATYLHDRCGIKQYQISFEHGGWEDNFEWNLDSKLALTFNTGSFIQT